MSETVKIRAGHCSYHRPRHVQACHELREPTADGRQCRIWLNEAQREIDRLRGALVHRPVDVVHISVQNGENLPDCEQKSVIKCKNATRLYAPPALGDVSQVQRQQPPPPEQAVTALQRFYMTSVGSLLDVLA